jgi:hypothetical protein
MKPDILFIDEGGQAMEGQRGVPDDRPRGLLEPRLSRRGPLPAKAMLDDDGEDKCVSAVESAVAFRAPRGSRIREYMHSVDAV